MSSHVPVRPPGVPKSSRSDRVDLADAEAEHQWEKTKWVVDEIARGEELIIVAQALRSIAAELRAQRVARRP